MTAINRPKEFAGFMISEGLLKKIDERAKSLGISRSEYVRQVLIEKLGV
jgi:metal-responsive CopG/Arc/MetJ family transcriptional regulator